MQKDCFDGSDEMNCTTKSTATIIQNDDVAIISPAIDVQSKISENETLCLQNKFGCENGECILDSWKCGMLPLCH